MWVYSFTFENIGESQKLEIYKSCGLYLSFNIFLKMRHLNSEMKTIYLKVNTYFKLILWIGLSNKNYALLFIITVSVLYIFENERDLSIFKNYNNSVSKLHNECNHFIAFLTK